MLEVPGRAGVLALRHQPLGLGVDRLGGIEQRLQAEQLQHHPERRFRSRERPPVALGDQLEQRRERPRGVEVVGERIEQRLAARRHELVLASLDAVVRLLEHEVPDPLHAGARLVERALGELERLTVMTRDQVGDHGLAPVPVQGLGELEDVAERLRHLLLGHPDHAVVHPQPGERLPPARLGLGDLVLVVGKDEVHPAAVDREVGAEELLGHRRALDVPPRTPLPPRRGPTAVLVGLARLPQREVQRVFLQGLGTRLLALVHVGGVAVRELAVAGEAADPEVDVAARLVRVVALDQGLDQGHDLADRLRRQGLLLGAAEAEAVGVLDVGAGHLPCVVLRRRARLSRGGVDLVVDVRDVDDQLGLVSDPSEEAPQEDEDHIGPRVADVDARVDRGPAGVDPDLRRLAGLEEAKLPAQRVPDPDLAHRSHSVDAIYGKKRVRVPLRAESGANVAAADGLHLPSGAARTTGR